MQQMYTTLDCLPCFLRQSLSVARICFPDREDIHRRVILAFSEQFSKMDLSRTPPDLAAELYALAGRLIGEDDPFQKHKRRANQRAMELLPDLEGLVMQNQDPLLAALNVSIIGNYIDEGVARIFDWEKALTRETDTGWGDSSYPRFKDMIGSTREILILGDNAGEIALDTLLVKVLKEFGLDVTYVVRDRPIINDATLADAEEVGMSELCRVVSSGVDSPGTVPSRCSPEFLKTLDQAELVVSKGQGNFEALIGRRPGIFYAFKAKCAVVAGKLGVKEGSSLFIYK